MFPMALLTCSGLRLGKHQADGKVLLLPAKREQCECQMSVCHFRPTSAGWLWLVSRDLLFR